MKDVKNPEPVITIPAALAVLANAVLLLLARADVLAGDLVPEITAVVNGVVLIVGLMLARRQVTPTFKAEAEVATADERARLKLGREVAASRTRAAKAAKRTRS